MFHLYADGSSSHITRDGGWAFIIQGDEGLISQDAGHISDTTNNAMEIYAAIQGLKTFSTRTHVIIYSDSAYLVNTMTNEWWKEWKNNDWVKHNGKETPNKSHWEELVSLIEQHNVKFIKVQGHSGDELNERCDKLAKEARKWNSNGNGSTWKRDFTI